ncbi:MAG: HlyD family secretion protein [Actinomycetota bacterium]|nr:HlyD family secretion protein [Actinomycetota bacterium]
MLRLKMTVAAVSIVATAVTTATLPSASSQTRNDVKLSVDFDAGGRVTAVLVKPGDHVGKGQVLARVDDTDAQASLTQAKAGLTSAQAQLDKLKAGGTPEETAQSNIALAQAQAAIDAATKSYDNAVAASAQDAAMFQAAVDQAAATLSNTRARIAQNVKARQLVIDQAAQALTAAQQQRAKNQQTLTDANAKLATDQASYNQQGCVNTPGGAGCSSLAQTIDQDKQAVTSAEQALAAGSSQVVAAANALAGAQQNDAAGYLDDARSEHDAAAQLTNATLNQAKGAVQAQNSLDQAAAGVRNAQLNRQSVQVANAARHPAPTASELAAAKASVTGAQAGVTTAEHNLAKTELRAPADGIIVTVAHHVGELSQSNGSAGGASGGSGFVTMVTFDGV